MYEVQRNDAAAKSSHRQTRGVLWLIVSRFRFVLIVQDPPRPLSPSSTLQLATIDKVRASLSSANEQQRAAQTHVCVVGEQGGNAYTVNACTVDSHGRRQNCA